MPAGRTRAFAMADRPVTSDDSGHDEEAQDQHEQDQCARIAPLDVGGGLGADEAVDEERQALAAPLNGLAFMRLEPKAVNSSGAVSPASRAIPRMAAVATPVDAVGRMTEITTFAREAPRASQPPAGRSAPDGARPRWPGRWWASSSSTAPTTP